MTRKVLLNEAKNVKLYRDEADANNAAVGCSGCNDCASGGDGGSAGLVFAAVAGAGSFIAGAAAVCQFIYTVVKDRS